MLLIIPSATWLHEAVPLAWVTCGPVPAGCCLCGPKKWLSPNCSSHHVRPLSFVDFKPCTTGILTDVLRWKRIINSAGSQKGNIYLVKKNKFCFFLIVSVYSGRFKVISYLFFFLSNVQLESHSKGLLAYRSTGSIHASYLKSVLRKNAELQKLWPP